MSSSPNECECDLLQNCGAWANEMESPWYPTFGQPLIYYSQVQPSQRCQRNRETEKEKSNCFKKAFRWYTQEHKPCITGCTDSPNHKNNTKLKGFAAWLDEKYNEFQQTNQVVRSKYILTQTSAVEIDNCETLELPETTKYKRIKSPWRKRRKYSKATEKGDVIVKSDKSIEIILKPKDLSRPASECCQRTKAQSCCNRSSSTVQSNASTIRSVTKRKSRSLTSVQEKELYVVPFEIPDYCAKREELGCAKTSSRKFSKKDSRCNKNKNRPKHVSCQCSKYVHKGMDAYSQFEDKETKVQDPLKSSNVPITPTIDDRNIGVELVTTESKTGVSQPNTTTEYVVQTEGSSFTATSTRSEKSRSELFTPVNEVVQTSDHSINLNDNSIMNTEFHLFMKIVRADKLKEK